MSQSQRAGSGSQQIQVMGDYHVHQGIITEEQAAEIARFQAKKAVAEYAEEAASIAWERIERLGAKVVELLSGEENLEAFKDPAFQASLHKAQIGAASTDRDEDYDLLARLLGQRATNRTRYSRASIDRAIEVVDSLDEASLQGLTMLWAVGSFSPGGTSLDLCLDALENLLGSFPHDQLPGGSRWLDHLDMLNLARFSPASMATLKKFTQLYSEKMPGIVTVGIHHTEVEQVNAAYKDEGLPLPPLVAHDMKEGFFRLQWRDESQLRTGLQASFPVETVDKFATLSNSVGRLSEIDQSILPKFEEAIDARPKLRLIRSWYDQIPNSPQPTSAGVTIAFSNCRRFFDFSKVQGLEEFLAGMA